MKHWLRHLATTILLLLIATNTAHAVSSSPLKPTSTPMIRLNESPSHLRLDPKGRFAAYVTGTGLGLQIVDLQTKAIFEVTKAQVGNSFFWSPDGFRLFYREMMKDKEGKVVSLLNVYDCALARNHTFDRWNYPTGTLTFDPRDLRMHSLSPKGIKTKRIFFPDERLAKWQISQRNESGKWLATQQAILWVSQGGFAMRKLDDDNSGVSSFEISPDGQSIVWATNKSRVYVSSKGNKPNFIGHGLDPTWHPEKTMILYAGARMVGNTPINYDLKLSDTKTSGRWLTSSQISNERWPQWHLKSDQILYTLDKTTDIYTVDFKAQ